MTTAKRNTIDMDLAGATLTTTLDTARAAQARHVASRVNQHVRATVGRLWYSARRWSWAIRFEAIGRVGAYEVDGARFEIVEQV